MGRHIVGIDLGTTNSVVASVDDSGSVVVLPNASGREITPSVVYFEPAGSVVVGEDAVQATAVDPDNGVQLIKRVIGTEFPLRVRGQRHTPESISALILRQLVSAVAGGGGGTVSAVITVPHTSAWPSARRRTRPASSQASTCSNCSMSRWRRPRTTVSPRAATGPPWSTTSAAGRSTPRCCRSARGQCDKRRLGELVLGTEAAKKDLSARTSRQVLVPTRAGRVSVTITRQDLDVACGDLYQTTTEIIERVLDAAHVDGVRGIDEVIMVGGSSRIPLLAERLTAMLGKKPRLAEPDLAVAKGAALRAHRIVRTPQLAALTASRGTGGLPVSAGQVTPVTPRAVSILVEDSFDPSGERSFVEHLVKANTSGVDPAEMLSRSDDPKLIAWSGTSTSIRPTRSGARLSRSPVSCAQAA